MDSPLASKGGTLVVNSVSRSGRILKKSSKLADFTSPDDIEANVKVKKIAPGTNRKLNMTQLTHIKMEPELEMNHMLPMDQKHHPNLPYMNQHDNRDFMHENFSMKQLPMLENNFMTQQIDHMEDDEDEDSDDIDDSDSDDQQMVIKTDDDPDVELLTPRRSIYMTEKSSKKKMLKDGKVIIGKAQRKDKGKTRFTAYMLWAKEARQQIQTSAPDMDFASVSKRLGEMWANVPTNVKYNWKRRAKRLANKLKKSNGKMKSQEPSKYIQQKYLNKSSTNLLNSNNNGTNNATGSTPMTKQQKQLQKLIKSEKTKKQAIQQVQKQQKELKKTGVKKGAKSIEMSSPSTSASYKSPGISPVASGRTVAKAGDLAPLDIAAHLNLLGDSLKNIGERLKEHEGQIAVSGGYCVLLDSLLCAICPLMCLTSFIPQLEQTETEEDRQYAKNLHQDTMDNIAYIMPGI